MLVRRRVEGARIYFPRRPTKPFGVSWNGRHLRPTGLTLESQLHEIAHLLLAPDERLGEIEFGLGPDPYRRSFVSPTVPKAEADREELDTVTLQLLLAHLFELDTAALREEFHTGPMTAARARDVRARYPFALPDAYWARAAALFL